MQLHARVETVSGSTVTIDHHEDINALRLIADIAARELIARIRSGKNVGNDEARAYALAMFIWDNVPTATAKGP